MIFLGLGSNIGNRKQNLMRAIELLNQHNDIIVRKISSIYETEPYGVKAVSYTHLDVYKRQALW